jgi:hypothetical protein
MLLLALPLLLLLLSALAVGIATLADLARVAGSKGPASAENRQARRWRRPATLLLASSVVGLAVWMSVWVSAFIRDPVVVLDGKRMTCAIVKVSEDLSDRAGEQCDEQSHDRTVQAGVEASVAGLAAAAASAVALWGASGRNRRQPASVTTSATTHDG